MWGLQKYQNHYEILFGRGCIDLENSAILLLLAQGKSDTLSFFEDCNMTKYLTNIFLLWINVNRLCSHVGLEFWTPNSFMCPKLTIFTTWKFRFTTLYKYPVNQYILIVSTALFCLKPIWKSRVSNNIQIISNCKHDWHKPLARTACKDHACEDCPYKSSLW